MVYNIWMSWINGLQRTDLVDLRIITYGCSELMAYSVRTLWTYCLQHMDVWIINGGL